MSIKIEQTDIGVDDWIDGATFVQVKVTIHRNPALWADLGPLYDQIAAAEERLAALEGAAGRQGEGDESSLGERTAAPAPKADEASLGEQPAVAPTVAAARAELDALVERAEALYEQYDADKEVWTLRGLEQSEVREITEAVRTEIGHGDPPVRGPRESVAKHAERVRAWQKALQDAAAEISTRCLERAVVTVNVAGVDKPAPSLEGLRRLRSRPHGARHFAELVAALEAITVQEVTIPAPHR